MTVDDMLAMEVNQAWIASQDLSRYAGEWIAVYEQAIIASDKDLGTVIAEVVSGCVGREKPLYMRVPEGTVIL